MTLITKQFTRPKPNNRPVAEQINAHYYVPRVTWLTILNITIHTRYED